MIIVITIGIENDHICFINIEVMKNILVPTDFSIYADNALEFAVKLAPKMNAGVLIVHVVDIPPLVESFYMEGYGVDKLYEEAKKNAEEKLAELRIKYKVVNINTAVFQGRIVEVLDEIYEMYDTQLIVMGTKGASGLKETFTGSNTERVIRNAPVPVLSIRDKTELDTIDKILIPTDGKENNEGFFNELRKLQKIFNAKVNILFINALHTFENEQLIKKSLMKYAERANLQDVEIDVKRAITPEGGIEEYVASNGIGLVAITTHGNQGLAHFIYGSLTENLANHLQVPVFSYNLKAIKFKNEQNANPKYSNTH